MDIGVAIVVRRLVVRAVVMGLGVAVTGFGQEKSKPVPDVIVFANGDRLSGTLVRGVGDKIVFKSDVAGEVTVGLDKVKELRSSGSFAVLRKDVKVTRTNVMPGTIEYADGQITVANPVGEPVVVPAKAMSFMIDQATYDKELERKPGPLYGWNGAVNAGATFVRATQNSETFTGGVWLERVIPAVSFLPSRNRTRIDFNEAFGKVSQAGSPDLKTNIFHAGAERDEYLRQRFYALAQTAFDHNFSQGLDLSQTYGVGLGWTPVKREKTQMDVKADVHYLKQQFETTVSNKNLVGSTVTESYRRTLPRKMVFTQMASVAPAWNDLRAYAANGSAGLVVPVYKRLSFQVNAVDNFLNEPAVGFKKNSFQTITGISYSLR